MLEFQEVGVFFRNTQVDDAVLAFAVHLGKLGAKALHCILVLDADAAETAPTLDEFETRVYSRMPEAIRARATCTVRRGHLLEETLRVARDKQLDLAIIGRRLPSSQLGLGARLARIVRKMPCSVMVVPELCQPHFGRILVAVDCSSHSRLAMEAAVTLAKAADGATPQLFALTVRQVTSRHELAGVSFEESAEAQHGYGYRDLDQFLSGIDSGDIPVDKLVVLSEDPAVAIAQVAMAKKMDIVVAGSRGVTSTAAALLGSNAERLLMACALPILIVKKKGETLRLLEALFSMR